MGSTAIYVCNNCQREFRASGGGGFVFQELRCEDCDHVVSVPREAGRADEEIKCSRCEGRMRGDLGPMCRVCRSRDLTVKEIEILYD